METFQCLQESSSEILGSRNDQCEYFQFHQSRTSLLETLGVDILEVPLINHWWLSDLPLLLSQLLCYAFNTPITSFHLQHIGVKYCQVTNKYIPSGKMCRRYLPALWKKVLIPRRRIFCWFNWRVDGILRVCSPIFMLLLANWRSVFCTSTCAMFLELLSATSDFKNRSINIFAFCRHSSWMSSS